MISEKTLEENTKINAKVLVLNQNYQPLNLCNAKRAIVLINLGKADLIENGFGAIRTPSFSFPVPSVIRLMALIKRPLKLQKLSRIEVFSRDKYSCIYCGKETEQLTLDHIFPRSRGGASSWENVASACMPCNHRKAGRTPKEAGMKLMKEVGAPKLNPYSLFTNKTIDENWYKFMPWLAKH